MAREQSQDTVMQNMNVEFHCLFSSASTQHDHICPAVLAVRQNSGRRSLESPETAKPNFALLVRATCHCDCCLNGSFCSLAGHTKTNCLPKLDRRLLPILQYLDRMAGMKLECRQLQLRLLHAIKSDSNIIVTKK